MIEDTITSKQKQFTFSDLFAGIGGFHLAFKRAGGKCVFVSEWDDKARETYKTNFEATEPELFHEKYFTKDIKEVDEKEVPYHDILTAGFPCQPFSQAGFKKGFEDIRGTLFYDIVRIIQEKQPQAFFLENVSHLLKHDNGRTFNVIKKTLTEDLGYSFHYKVVRASDYGLPQYRPRLFMVGFKNTDINFEFPPKKNLKYTMSDIWGGECNKKIGYTLRCGGRGSGIGDRRNWDAYLVDGEEKRLTPREGKMMMGFPEDFTFPVSEAEAMKQLGNAVAVDAIYEVAAEIVNKLNEVYERKCDKTQQRRMERTVRFSESPGR